MKSRIKITGPRRARRPLVNAILLLSVASQSLAAPIHVVMVQADRTEAQAVAEACPVHQEVITEAGNPEPCECSVGACCKARIDRLPALTASHIESRPAESRPVLLAESVIALKSFRIMSGAQSRAPPVTSNV